MRNYKPDEIAEILQALSAFSYEEWQRAAFAVNGFYKSKGEHAKHVLFPSKEELTPRINATRPGGWED